MGDAVGLTGLYAILRPLGVPVMSNNANIRDLRPNTKPNHLFAREDVSQNARLGQ